MSDGANPDPKCHPFAPAGECLLPFPSSFYQKADTTTATGMRVALPPEAMPLSQIGVPMDPARLNLADGFSPATPIVVNFRVRVDETLLPTVDDPTQSLQPNSTVQLFRFDTGDRVPLFAEVDKNVTDPMEDQVLLIHPLTRLLPKTRYVVALRGMKDTSGNEIHVAPFDALVAGNIADGSRLHELPDYAPIFAMMEKAGLSRSVLTMAWDFTTGSDEQLHSHLLSMRDSAFATWEKMQLKYDVTPTPNIVDDHLLIELVGTFDVPSFLVDDTPPAVLKLDDAGNPVYRGVSKYPLVVHVPKCAQDPANYPLPIMVFGHGLFGLALSEMNSGYQKQVIDQLCMIQVGTDWIGLSNNDISTIVSHVLANFTNFPIVTDRLQQAQLNFAMLAHMATRLLPSDPNLMINGKPITDGSQIYYYGISQGGIEGNTFMAITPDVLRGVVNVAGGEYSIMLTRSVDFIMLKSALNVTYPAQRDQEVLLAFSQAYFDFSDPISFVTYSIQAPLPGLDGKPMAPKHILLQESKNDAQVTNIATRIIVRGMGVPLLDPANESVYGIPEAMGPLDSAYTQWDIHPMPPPESGNVPIPTTEGIGYMGYQAHGGIRKLPQLIDQLGKFFKPDGKVVATCNGPCSFQ
jgi:hypothetical protein